MLIALFGAPGAGKDTVAAHLVEKHGFVRVAFADKVRELAYEVLAPTLRDVVDRKGWDYCKRELVIYREILERVGDGARKVFGNDFWIQQIEDDVFDLVDSGKDVVITDLRKENEMRFVHDVESQDVDSTIWHIVRPGCEKRPFDEWKEEWAEFKIHNLGGIAELHQRVDEVLELCR